MTMNTLWFLYTVALFAIAREAATNIVKHAGASRAMIRLSSAGAVADLVVSDDGRGCGSALREGFRPRAGDGAGNGILGMAERARLLGGSLEAGDLPEGGFAVHARVPFAAKGSEQEVPYGG